MRAGFRRHCAAGTQADDDGDAQRVPARLRELDVTSTMTAIDRVMTQLCDELSRVLVHVNAELD